MKRKPILMPVGFPTLDAHVVETIRVQPTDTYVNFVTRTGEPFSIMLSPESACVLAHALADMKCPSCPTVAAESDQEPRTGTRSRPHACSATVGPRSENKKGKKK